jgi:hypothetical protein
MADYGVPANTDEAGYDDALFQLVITHGVMPTVWRPSFAAEPGERPIAHALARLQAGTPGWVVSGARHVAIDLDPAGRILLELLDGRRTVDELVVAMQAVLADAGLTLPAEAVTELTHRQLWLFARQGLLLQDGGGAITRRSG